MYYLEVNISQFTVNSLHAMPFIILYAVIQTIQITKQACNFYFTFVNM